jgi:hypothetical protein
VREDIKRAASEAAGTHPFIARNAQVLLPIVDPETPHSATRLVKSTDEQPLDSSEEGAGDRLFSHLLLPLDGNRVMDYFVVKWSDGTNSFEGMSAVMENILALLRTQASLPAVWTPRSVLIVLPGEGSDPVREMSYAVRVAQHASSDFVVWCSQCGRDVCCDSERGGECSVRGGRLGIGDIPQR